MLCSVDPSFLFIALLTQGHTKNVADGTSQESQF